MLLRVSTPMEVSYSSDKQIDKISSGKIPNHWASEPGWLVPFGSNTARETIATDTDTAETSALQIPLNSQYHGSHLWA